MNFMTLPHVLALRLHYAEPPSFSVTEMVLLAVLTVLAVVGFFARFDRVLRNIFTARKDPDFHLAPIGRRIWDFFWEVLCQAKVIRERPLPGLAHAFVFWGFCAFALVTLNHFAAGFGFGFLDPDGCSAASTSGSPPPSRCCRRRHRRPLRPPLPRAARWLGRKVSYESGVIALLIFLLMVTYLAAFLSQRPPPPHASLVDAHAVHSSSFCRSSRTPSTCTWSSARPPSFSRAAASATFRRSPAMKTSASSPARTSRNSSPPGLLLRRMRPLHRALPRQQHRQGSQPERNHPRPARLSQRLRPASEDRCSASTTRRKPPSSAPPAAPANTNAPSASSICPSSSACAAAR